jgi:hypothetical protein
MPHQPKIVPAPKRAAPRRASSSARGYDHRHRKARAALLAEHPVCQVCTDAFATDAHHVDGDTSNTDPANYLAVCEACHHGVLHRRR